MVLNIMLAILLCVGSFAVSYLVMPKSRYRLIFAFVITCAAVARIATVFYVYRNGTETFGTDGLLYHNEGMKIAGKLASGQSLGDIKYTYTIYTAFVGILYYITGINRYIASFFNIAFAMASGLMLIRIALNHKYSIFNSFAVGACFLFFPNLVLWTADTRKEAILIFVCFLCWLSIQKFTLSLERKTIMAEHIARIAFICILMWLGTLIRIYMFIPFMLGIAISQMILFKKTGRKLCLIFIAAVFASALLILAAAMYPLTQNYHAVIFPKDQMEGLLQDVSSKINTISNIVARKNLFDSILYSLVQPNPTKLNIADIMNSSKTQLVVQVDMIVWYICMILIFTGIYTAFKNKDSFLLGLLSFIAAYILINALIAENVADTVYRYRAAIVGLVVLFIDGRVIGKIFKGIGYIMRPEDDTSPTAYTEQEVLSMMQHRNRSIVP